MAVRTDLLNNSDPSSDEDSSDVEISYSSEDESMEKESEEDESLESEITIARGKHITTSFTLKFSSFTTLTKLARSLRKSSETVTNRSEEEDFWTKYPYLKGVARTVAALGPVSEYYVFQKAKRIGDDRAKEVNEKGKALFLEELEICRMKCELVADIINALISGK